MMEKLALGITELAEALGIGKSAAYILCMREDFPAIKIGERRWIIPVDGLKAWLEKQGKERAG